MRWKMRSRRMPALLTRMSTRPKAVSVAFTISSAFFGSAMESVEAMASPPLRLISSTTCCAGPASVPAPSRLAPMSQTTTRAPSCASKSAMPRPMPRPAPVTMATLPATMPVMRGPCSAGQEANSEWRIVEDARRLCYSLLAIRSLAPHLVGHLDDPPQLGPLLILGEQIALLGGGKAALAGDAELLERGVFHRLLDAALEIVLALELAALGGDDTEHDELALGQHAQRLEAAGAGIVVFHEVA